MPTTHRTTSIIFGDISKAVRNKMYLNTLTYVITPNESYYIENGVKVYDDEMKAKYPTQTKKLLTKGENPDKTKIP